MWFFALKNWRLAIELSWDSWKLFDWTFPVERKLQLTCKFQFNYDHFQPFDVWSELDTTIWNFGIMKCVQKQLAMHKLVFIAVICIL